MNGKKNRVIICAALSVLLAACNALCFPVPTMARVINSEILSVQLGQAETASKIESNLLEKDGQIVRVDGNFTEMVIPITLWSTMKVKEGEENLTGIVSVVSGDEDSLTAVPDIEHVTLSEEEQTVNLTIKRVEAEEATPDTENEEPTPDTENETPDTESETPTEEEEATPDTENETPDTEQEIPEEGSESETPEETEPDTETPAEGENTVTDTETEIETSTEEHQISNTEQENASEETYSTGLDSEMITNPALAVFVGTGTQAEELKNIPELPEMPQTEVEAETESENEAEAEAEAETESKNEADAETESETGGENEAEAEIESETENGSEAEADSETVTVPATLFVEVTFTCEEETFSATIVIEEEQDTEAIPVGDLEFCQSQYDPKEPVVLTAKEEAECSLSGFPPMTKYQIEGENYLLYSGSRITIPAGKEARIDLSKTEYQENLVLKTGAGVEYRLNYVEIPQFSEENSPLIIGEEGIIPDVPKVWGAIEAVCMIEQLVVTENTPEWAMTETVTVAADENGNLLMRSQQAEAGTYRVTVSWIEQEQTIYQIKIPFFIQYGNRVMGGTGQ